MHINKRTQTVQENELKKGAAIAAIRETWPDGNEKGSSFFFTPIDFEINLSRLKTYFPTKTRIVEIRKAYMAHSK